MIHILFTDQLIASLILTWSEVYKLNAKQTAKEMLFVVKLLLITTLFAISYGISITLPII